jgi:hypothetical protein
MPGQRVIDNQVFAAAMGDERRRGIAAPVLDHRTDLAYEPLEQVAPLAMMGFVDRCAGVSVNPISAQIEYGGFKPPSLLPTTDSPTDRRCYCTLRVEQSPPADGDYGVDVDTTMRICMAAIGLSLCASGSAWPFPEVIEIELARLDDPRVRCRFFAIYMVLYQSCRTI